MSANHHCQYSPNDALHCCDDFNSLGAEFKDSCSALKGKLSDGACQVLNLPWLPESAPGSWRGSCATIATAPAQVWPDIIVDEEYEPSEKPSEHADLYADKLSERKQEISKDLHACGEHHHNIDSKLTSDDPHKPAHKLQLQH